jgi:transcriptional regulator with XRE-family HTH domain
MALWAYCAHMMTPTQCKMARVAIGWGVRELAAAAKVGVSTVTRFEAGKGVPIPATVMAMRTALESAGVEFIPQNGGGAGVRLRKVTSDEERT